MVTICIYGDLPGEDGSEMEIEDFFDNVIKRGVKVIPSLKVEGALTSEERMFLAEHNEEVLFFLANIALLARYDDSDKGERSRRERAVRELRAAIKAAHGQHA
jgi:hypothetical protein